jgi:predicted nucleotidyltransferase
MGKAKKRGRKTELAVLTPLIEPLTALQHLIDQFNQRGVIIGGIAASLLGQPRFTADLDAVILMSTEELPKLMEIAAQEGFVGRIADVEAFARKNRVLLLQHDASGIKVDISLGILPFEAEMVERGQEVLAGKIRLRLPTPEDLIIMKAVAHRPKDLSDIQAIAARYPDLDKERIQFWVEEFGKALDFPDLWPMISQML